MKRIFEAFGITAAVLGIFLQATVRAASNDRHVLVGNDLPDQDKLKDFDYKDFNFWAAQCRVLENEQKYTEALAACERAITLNPKKKSVEIWAARSNALFELKKYPEAVASYDRVLEIAPKYSLAFAQRCVALSQLGKYEDAIASCESALRVNGNWGKETPALAWYNRGLALRKLGRFEEAIASFDRAVTISPNYSLAWADRCVALSALERYDDALASCYVANKPDGDWGKSSPAIGWNNRALVLKKLGWLEEAIASYERALAINPNDATTWANQGIVLEKLGRYEKALTSYNRAIQVNGNYSGALAHRSATLNRLNKYQEALASCEAALKGDGVWEDISPAYAWNYRSGALIGLGQYQEALASAERAIALIQDYAEAWNNKGVSLWNLENYKDAEAATRHAVEINPKYTQAWFNYGRILSHKERYKEAVVAYDQALDGDVSLVDDPTLANIWVNKAVAFWHLKDYQNALDSTNIAIELNRDSFESWYNQAIVLLDWGRSSQASDSQEKYTQALNAYDQANRISPNNVYVWTGRGIALAGLGQNQEALAAFETALNLDPNYAPAQQERDKLLQKFKM